MISLKLAVECLIACFALAVITIPVWIPKLVRLMPPRQRDERPAVKRRAF